MCSLFLLLFYVIIPKVVNAALMCVQAMTDIYFEDYSIAISFAKYTVCFVLRTNKNVHILKTMGPHMQIVMQRLCKWWCNIYANDNVTFMHAISPIGKCLHSVEASADNTKLKISQKR